jgi:5-bromo-4-chloroindolyl phosphate hydrolysis protein
MSRKKNLMDDYYIVIGILFVFFIGSLSIFIDIVCNTEEEIIIHKPKPVSSNLTNYYEDDLTED